MAMLKTHDVRGGNVGILVCFVGVVGSDTALGSEGEFGYNVTYFVHFVWEGYRRVM